LITRNHDVFRLPGIAADALAVGAPHAVATATAALGERVVALIQRLCSEVEATAFRQRISLIADSVSVLARRERWNDVVAIADERFLERANLLGCWREYRLLLKLCLLAAEHSGETTKRLRLLFRIAHKSLQMQDYEAGRPVLKEIAATIGETGSSSEHAELFSLRAFFAELDKSNDDPLELFNASLTIHEARGDVQAVAAVRCFMGNLYLSRKQFAEAKSCYKTCLSATPNATIHMKIRVDAECGLALCNINLSQLLEAKTSLQGAVLEAERYGYEAGLSQAHFYLALAADVEGNREVVLRHLVEAERHARSTNPRVLVGASLLRMKLGEIGKSS
jgi:tetratricopeptide (TPR) repeat protein